MNYVVSCHIRVIHYFELNGIEIMIPEVLEWGYPLYVYDMIKSLSIGGIHMRSPRYKAQICGHLASNLGSYLYNRLGTSILCFVFLLRRSSSVSNDNTKDG